MRYVLITTGKLKSHEPRGLGREHMTIRVSTMFILQIIVLVLIVRIQKVAGLTCLSCRGVTHPRSCTTSVICKVGEICGVKKFASNEGDLKYSLGCVENEVCVNQECDINFRDINKSDSPRKCVQCCNGDMCNAGGNGELGAAGTDFILAFGTNFYPFATVALQLLVVSREAGQGVVRIPYLQVSETIQLSSGLTTYNISSDILPDNLNVSDKGIRLTTEKPVTLFAMNLGRSTSDGFYVFPLSSLSTQYHLLSSMPYVHSIGHFQSEAVVVSPSNDNQITLDLRFTSGNLSYAGQTYKSGNRMHIVLNASDVFQFYQIGEITGTQVQSSQPVAVMSGNRCNVFEDGPGCEHFCEMIPPLRGTDTEFIVPKFHDHHNGTLQITATENGTVVKISGKTTHTIHLREGQFHEKLILEATVISASKNVHVTMFPHGANDTNHFDPFMITIPGINKYLSEYDIAVPRFDYANYIAIVVRQTDMHTLRLDGEVLQKKLDIEHVEVKGVRYAVLSHRVQDGAHTVHSIGNKTFGLMVYGNKEHDSYGFLGGISTN